MKKYVVIMYLLISISIVVACTDTNSYTVIVDGNSYQMQCKAIEKNGQLFITAEDLAAAFGIYYGKVDRHGNPLFDGDIVFSFYDEEFNTERNLYFTENLNLIRLYSGTDYEKYYDEPVMIIQEDTNYIDLEAFCDSAYYEIEHTRDAKTTINYVGTTWKKAYIDLLNSIYMWTMTNYDYTHDNKNYFGLADIDKDGVPELFTGYQTYNDHGSMYSFMPEWDIVTVEQNYYGQPYLAEPEGVYICNGSTMGGYSLVIGEDIDIGYSIILRHFPFAEGSTILNLDRDIYYAYDYTEEEYAEFKAIINEDTNILKYELTLENIEMLLGDYE